MVNLTFCRLEIPDRSSSDNSEAQHSSISIIYPFSGTVIHVGISLLIYGGFSDWCLPNCPGLWSSAFGFRYSRRDLRFLWFEGESDDLRRSWIMIRFAGCFGIMMDFFKQPRASVQIKAGILLELFGFFCDMRQILFTSVPLYYFELKSDWLPW